jgi:hypothetical protein
MVYVPLAVVDWLSGVRVMGLDASFVLQIAELPGSICLRLPQLLTETPLELGFLSTVIVTLMVLPLELLIVMGSEEDVADQETACGALAAGGDPGP